MTAHSAPTMFPPRIAIVGRPNVGKSTLFNRLAGRRLAIVDDTPGVTRDRRESDARYGEDAFIIIDTPGLEEAPEEALEGRMRQQTAQAIEEAAAVLFVVDARAGVTPLDQRFADLIRKSGKPVILIANKAEGSAGEGGVLDAYALGLGDPIALSAEHAIGMGELFEALAPFIAITGDDFEPDDDEEENWDNP